MVSFMRRNTYTTARWLLIFALVVTTTGVLQILNLKPVFADDGAYPWQDAQYVDANYDWGYPTTCPSSDTNCMAFYGWKVVNGVNTKFGEADPWGYYLRNCTSYSAWMIKHVFNIDIPSNWGNATSWDSNATGPGHPYTNDSSPQVGDIAQWVNAAGGLGHVAYVWHVESNGTADLYDYNEGNNNVWGVFSSSNTTASGSEGTPDNYIHLGTFPFEAAFDANNGSGYLYTYNSGTGSATNTGLGVASGTSPSIADTSDGWVVAFHAANGDLYTYNVDTGTAIDTQQGMASGTSPSIAASPSGGFEVAFQANTSGNYMYLYSSSSGTSATTQGMATGTSPAIVGLSSGYEEAFQANGGNLYVYGSNSSGNTQQGMASGTSPSISAPINGSNFQVAFQANTGNLYTYSSATGSATNTQQGMASSTSPTITYVSNGYEEAFQANNGILYVYGSNSSGSTGQGMVSGSSPSISALTSGSNFEGVFDANNGSGYLYTYSSASGSAANTSQGILSGTSPSVTAL